MKKNLSISQIVILICLLTLIGALVLWRGNLTKIKAATPGQQDGVDLHIKIEASNDNGTTWHNYSGTDFSGGETISANPGDTILVKAKLWDDARVGAVNVLGSGTVSNGSYASSYAVIDAGDFLGDFLGYTANYTVPLVAGLTTETTGYEAATVSITLSNSLPAGETIILGQSVINNYNPLVSVNPFQLFGRAKAIGVGKESAVRISINGNLPATGKISLDDLIKSLKNSLDF